MYTTINCSNTVPYWLMIHNTIAMPGPLWNLSYMSGRSPRDTGIPSLELIEVIEDEQATQGYALNLSRSKLP